MTKMDPGGSKRAQPYFGPISAQFEAIDIAELAIFLVSDESRSINGAVVPTDSGWFVA